MTPVADRLATLAWLALLGAVASNCAEAVADPDGAWWDSLRFAASTLFAAALAAAIAAACLGR